jgi:hypothetical protein
MNNNKNKNTTKEMFRLTFLLGRDIVLKFAVISTNHRAGGMMVSEIHR